MVIYFQGAGSTGNYFRGAREQTHNFGDLVSFAKKKQKKQNKERPPFCLIFFKIIFYFPDPPCKF